MSCARAETPASVEGAASGFARPCRPAAQIRPTQQRACVPRGAPGLLLCQEAGAAPCAPGRRPERGVSGAWTETLARRARRQSPALLRASGQPEGEPATDGARRSRMAVGACGDRHGHAPACGRLGRRAYKRRNVTSRRKSRFRPREWCPAVGRAKSTASRSCAVGSIASSSVPLESHRWRMLRAFVSSPRLCCITGRAGSSRPRVRSQVQPEGARAPTWVEDELQPLGR